MDDTRWEVQIANVKKIGSYPNEKIILSRRDMEGGHFILFEMAVTWEPLVGF